MAFDPKDLLQPRDVMAEPAPLAGTRAERMQRLQIGLLGIAAMLLLVALASVVSERAQMTRDDAVPEAAPTVEPSETSAPRDPLADAGVVPEVPAEPTATPSPTAAEPMDDVPPPPATNAPLE